MTESWHRKVASFSYICRRHVSLQCHEIFKNVFTEYLRGTTVDFSKLSKKFRKLEGQLKVRIHVETPAPELKWDFDTDVFIRTLWNFHFVM